VLTEQLLSCKENEGAAMKRRIHGLNENVLSANDQVPEGVFLVRVDPVRPGPVPSGIPAKPFDIPAPLHP